MSKNTTKRSLLASVFALVLCVAMLVGSTFAWFTDTATTGVNKIQSGKLDVKLSYLADNNEWKEVTKDTKLFKDGALWEPGHTEVAYLKVENAGNLALKYKLSVNVANEVAGKNANGGDIKLSDYIKMGVVENQDTSFADRNDARDAVAATAGSIATYTKTGSIAANDTNAQYVALVVYMPETVGNEANYVGETAPSIDLGVKLVATQYTEESDSFNNQYDKDATLDFEPVSTVADLKAAAAAGKNVMLTQDVAVTEAVTFDKAVSIDLNGKTLTNSLDSNGYSLVTKGDTTIVNGIYKGTGTARGIGAYGNLTMDNVTVDVAGLVGVACSAADSTYTITNSTIKGGYALCNFSNNAKIEVSDCVLEGSGVGIYHNGSNSGLKLNVTRTTINSGNDGTDTTGVYISGSTATKEKAGYQQVTLTDCTVKGNAAVEVKYTDLTMNNCTAIATVDAANASYVQNNNGATTNGFAVVSTDNTTENKTPKPEGTITINGGSYTGLVGLHSLPNMSENFPGFVDTTYVIK